VVEGAVVVAVGGDTMTWSLAIQKEGEKRGSFLAGKLRRCRRRCRRRCHYCCYIPEKNSFQCAAAAAPAGADPKRRGRESGTWRCPYNSGTLCCASVKKGTFSPPFWRRRRRAPNKGGSLFRRFRPHFYMFYRVVGTHTFVGSVAIAFSIFLEQRDKVLEEPLE